MAIAFTPRKLDCKDLHSYLKTLPGPVIDRLYNHPATCIAVFRELPDLARQYVMRTLFVEQPVSQAVIGQWVVNKFINEHRYACKSLTELRVWYEQTIPGGQPGWVLNQTFRNNTKVALLGGGNPWIGGRSTTADKYAKDIPFLDKYAQERWECVLHFMVGSSEGIEGVSRDIIEVLNNSGLMRVEAADPNPTITAAGFQFLLMDTASQVWYFMLQYLETVEHRGMDLVECLSFLFQLSFSTIGQDYSTDGMSESQLKFLQHLREFGLVYQRKRKSQRYYPTCLAVNLASGLSDLTHHDQAGFIMVETNYRIYAYTDSPLKIALLAIFCDMLYRFPTMVVCNLSRVSVREALTRGITAEQILNFLRSHAHPKMLASLPVLPPTITDQIRLWELERDRLSFSDGVLYSQFNSQADYELLSDYAKDLGVLVWENAIKRVMVVTKLGHDDVKKFWKRQKTS